MDSEYFLFYRNKWQSSENEWNIFAGSIEMTEANEENNVGTIVSEKNVNLNVVTLHA